MQISQDGIHLIKYFEELSQNYSDYYLVSSEVFIVKNKEDYKFSIGDFL